MPPETFITVNLQTTVHALSMNNLRVQETITINYVTGVERILESASKNTRTIEWVTRGVSAIITGN